MAKNKITRILLADDKEMTKTSGPNGALSRLFRKILLELDIMPPKFGQLLHEYIMDSRHHVPNNKRDQTSMRGNLTKEFARQQMTWKVFCKALRFLQILKIELAIKAYHSNGRTSLHSIEMEFGDRRNLRDFEEKLEQSEEKEQEIPIQVFEKEDAAVNQRATHAKQVPALLKPPAAPPPFDPPYVGIPAEKVSIRGFTTEVEKSTSSSNDKQLTSEEYDKLFDKLSDE